MLDFTIAQHDLSEMLGLLTTARTSSSAEILELTILRSEARSAARFAVTGRDFECAIAAESPGFAQIPLDLLPKIQNIAGTFADDPVRIRIESGRVRVKSVTISHPGVALSAGRARPIDIPEDASTLDLLAVQAIFSPNQIEQSGLTLKVHAAERSRVAAIDSASSILADLGVNRSEIDLLAQKHIAQHAQATRNALDL